MTEYLNRNAAPGGRMTAAPLSRYALDHAGHRLAVQVSAAEHSNVARLFVDGQQVDEQRSPRWGRARLQSGEVTVVVAWWWLGRVGKCVLVEERDTGEDEPAVEETPFAPPPGSRAAKLARLKEERPVLYASRHVAIALLRGLIPLLGIGALLRSLLPRIDWSLPKIDWSWIPRPDIHLPDIWSWIPWPDIDLPDMPGWLPAILGSLKWVIPILVAVFVAIDEVERRQRKQR